MPCLKPSFSFLSRETEAQRSESLIQDKNPSVPFQEEINHSMPPAILKYSSREKTGRDIIESQSVGSSCCSDQGALLGKISILSCPTHSSLPGSDILQSQCKGLPIMVIFKEGKGERCQPLPPPNRDGSWKVGD